MKISDSIRALLKMRGLRQIDLVEPLGMKSSASLNNKFSNNRWDASDLVKVADTAGCRVGFILPDGEHLILDQKDGELK